jgi:hypothetical protein
MLILKKFPRVIPPNSRFKGEGMEGKREGRIRKNGRKGIESNGR